VPTTLGTAFSAPTSKQTADYLSCPNNSIYWHVGVNTSFLPIGGQSCICSPSSEQLKNLRDVYGNEGNVDSVYVYSNIDSCEPDTTGSPVSQVGESSLCYNTNNTTLTTQFSIKRERKERRRGK
jgi:hypothetical protein